MTIPSPQLYALILRYLSLVDSGDMSDARTDAHNAMMDRMRAERFDFVTRDEARELAIEIVAAIKALFDVECSHDQRLQ